MAKNYTFAEAVEIINNGTDLESITDIGKRYPILLHKVSKVATLAGDAFVDLMSYMPEHLTANKVNTAMKNAVSGADTETEETEVEEEAAETKAPKKSAKKEEAKPAKEGTDYEAMTGKELWELLGEKGKRKDCKEKMGGAKKEDMIAYINKYGLDSEPVEEEVEAEETEEATEAANPYEGISAMDLFKECKKRGLKAAPKKPAKYYVELLMKADEEAGADKEEEADEEGWGEEVEEPKKEEKKPAKKAAAKKPAPAKEEAEDDDWDI